MENKTITHYELECADCGGVEHYVRSTDKTWWHECNQGNKELPNPWFVAIKGK
jgi:hypothetical protein